MAQWRNDDRYNSKLTMVRGTMVSAPDHLAVPRLLQEFQGTKLASWRFVFPIPAPIYAYTS
jgi:hypothetical protein